MEALITDFVIFLFHPNTINIINFPHKFTNDDVSKW